MPITDLVHHLELHGWNAYTGDPVAMQAIERIVHECIALGGDERVELARRLNAHPSAIMGVVRVCRNTESPETHAFMDDMAARVPESLHAWIIESTAAMYGFLGAGGISTFAMINLYDLANGRVSGRLSLGFELPRNPPHVVIWESCDLAVDAILPLAFECMKHTHEVLCAHAEKPESPSLGPLQAFHPERFRRTRMYADNLGSIGAGGSLPRLADLEALTALIADECNAPARNAAVGRRDRLRRGDPPIGARLDAEESLAMAYAKFRGAGRQIFEVAPALSTLFRNTDIDDIPVEMVRLPYPVLYLSVGPQNDIELAPGWTFDGAYIEHHPEHRLMTFTLTAAPPSVDELVRWHAFGEPVIALSFPPEVAGFNLGAAIDHELADRMNRLREEIEAGDRDATGEFAGIPGAEAIGQVNITTGTRAQHQLDAMDASTPALRAAMRLLVNALCFLTAYPDDAVVRWPEGTPERLRKLAINGSPKERTRAISKLESLGYSKIHLCGSQIPETVASTPPEDAESTSVRTHWRRGHWRRQPYGERQSLRRLMWIQPTLVGSQGEDAKGHVYRLR